MKVVLFGCNGQVGWELQRSLAPLGQVIALGRQGKADLCGDLERFDDLRYTLRTVRPDIVVNAAAYTFVDQAEAESDLAERVNAAAPGILAEEIARCDALLVHYSTDYVFDGSGTAPWGEDATPAPINVYGATKWKGEEAVRRSGARHLIFRTEWVYASRGRNFIRTILHLASQRDTLQVIDDQFGAPTGAELIADITAHAIRLTTRTPSLVGTYHLAAGGETSWYGYARFIVQVARQANWPTKLLEGAIVPVNSAVFPTTARRPNNSRLCVHKLEDSFGVVVPEWQSGVRRVLTEILSAKSEQGE